jgi:choline dehydrogenase
MSPTGERSSTESAYLTPDVLARPNLTVAVGMRVLKILLENNPGRSSPIHTPLLFTDDVVNAGGEPSAVGVEFTSDRQRGAGPIYRARAHSEVVACAGAVNTPHLLQLSGIGPAKHLAEHGVPVLVDAPGVGSSLEDHATVITLWRDRTGNSLNYMNRNGVWDLVRQVWGLGRWLLTGDGPFGSNVCGFIGNIPAPYAR